MVFLKNKNTNNLYFVAIIHTDQTLVKKSEKNNYFVNSFYIIYFNTSRDIAEHSRVVPVLAMKLGEFV